MTSKIPAARIALAAASLALALALVPAALAGKPTHGGGGGTTSGTGGTISLVVLNSPDGLAHFGGTVTFNVSTTATTQPFVELQCFQNGIAVGQRTQGFFATALGDQWFQLGPTSLWQSGAGDCTAYLENYDSYSQKSTVQKLASTSFHVYA